MTDFLVLGARATVLCASVVACLVAYRWITRQSKLFGTVFALGFLARAWSGLALFAISYGNLPILRDLHAGSGFWKLAPDSMVYHDLAASGIGSLGFGAPSPAFVGVLSLWFQFVGPGAASALLFNLLCYTATICLVVVSSACQRRQDLGTTSVIALSCSPVLILVATQALKDTFVVLLIAIIVVAGTAVLRQVFELAGRSQSLRWSIAALAAGVGVMAGIRAYYAVLSIVAFAGASLVLVVWSSTKLRWRQCVTLAFVVGILWTVLMLGAGPYYRGYGGLLSRVIGFQIPIVSTGLWPSDAGTVVSTGHGLNELFSALGSARRGFARTRGGTTLVEAGSGVALRDDVSTGRRAINEMLSGVAYLLVPVSLLGSLGLVELEGGRGFLAITDVDTVFVDVTLLITVVVMWRHRNRAVFRFPPEFCYVLMIALISGLAMGYVVVNYGTLFRLRIMSITPLWLLPLTWKVPDLFQPKAAPERDSVPGGGGF